MTQSKSRVATPATNHEMYKCLLLAGDLANERAVPGRYNRIYNRVSKSAVNPTLTQRAKMRYDFLIQVHRQPLDDTVCSITSSHQPIYTGVALASPEPHENRCQDTLGEEAIFVEQRNPYFRLSMGCMVLIRISICPHAKS